MDEFSRHNQEAASSFDMTSVSREAAVGSRVLSCFQGGMEERTVAHSSGLALNASCLPTGLAQQET